MEPAVNAMGVGSVLVPVDYSDNSIMACRYAANIALKSGWEIQLFHTFYSPAFDLIELSGGVHTQQQLRADVTDKLLEDEKEELERFKTKLFDLPEFKKIDSAKINSVIESGIARDEIIAHAQKTRPQMVVMGARGADNKSTSILGSITEHAIKRLNVPVLAIPQEYKISDNIKQDKIVYLTNFNESDFLSIKKLMRFANLFNMNIHCIHIGPKKDKWEMLKMEGLKEYFQKAYKKSSVECHILSNIPDMVHAVDKYVNENGINLIALTHQQRNLIKQVFRPSVTRRFFYHSELPLLVFHS